MPDSQTASVCVRPGVQVGGATWQTSGVVYCMCLMLLKPHHAVAYGPVLGLDGRERLTSAMAPFNHWKEHLDTWCWCMFVWFVGEFSTGMSPLVQSVELGSVEKKKEVVLKRGMGGRRWTVTMCQKTSKGFLERSPIPCITTVQQTTLVHKHTHLLSCCAAPLCQSPRHVCADWFLWGKVILNSCWVDPQFIGSSKSAQVGQCHYCLYFTQLQRHQAPCLVNSVGGGAISLSHSGFHLLSHSHNQCGEVKPRRFN